MERHDRRSLRQALIDAEPWLDDTEHGPRAVTAGMCDRCGDRPRLLPTCGSAGFEAVCRGCAAALGDAGWCEGHRDEGEHARAWAEQLPQRWGDVVVLFWVATGELRLRREDLPHLPDEAVQAALSAG